MPAGQIFRFKPNFFHNTVFRCKMTSKSDYLMKVIYMIIAFTFSMHKSKRKKKRDLQYHNKHRLKFTFPVCILSCYPFMESGLVCPHKIDVYLPITLCLVW